MTQVSNQANAVIDPLNSLLMAALQGQAAQIAVLTKQLEAKVSERDSALQEAQALTHIGSWQWDVTGTDIEWSDELYRIFGLEPQVRPIGFEEFISMIHPDDQEQVQGIIGAAFGTAQPFDFRHRIILPDGTERVLHGMGKVVTDAEGKPLRMLGTSQDVTQQARLDKAKDEFISLASHQLRTPLTVIRMYSEMLADGMVGDLNPIQREHTQRISEATVRLIDLVGEMLTISRLELEQATPRFEDTDVNELIGTYVAELQPVAKARGTKLVYEPVGNPVLPLEPTSFGQVIRNLLENAITYAASHDGVVKVIFRPVRSGYEFTVQDNGIGVPEAARERIFERFFRAENANDCDANGTGLGLYLVRLIVNAHGGSVSCLQVPTGGSRFVVHLPKPSA